MGIIQRILNAHKEGYYQMTDSPGGTNQKIFNMDLSVETISTYLLCSGLTDSGASVSVKNLMEIWNGSPSQLHDSLKILEERNVLCKIISDQGDHAVYRIEDPEKWKCH